MELDSLEDYFNKAEAAMHRHLKQAVDRALADRSLIDVSSRLAYVAGFVSNDYPEVADQLMRIWRQPGFALCQD